MTELKNDLRKKFIKIRQSLPINRKIRAEKQLLKISKYNFKNFLSFSSKKSEINLYFLNKKLSLSGKLLLPKVVDNSLKIYKINNLQKDLMKGEFDILEPNPIFCEEFSLEKIDCILVPGLVFDKNNNRLGYGKGFYDRLLKDSKATTIGIGYLEQFVDIVPSDPHDITLNHVLLF
ncbi:MAG: 5-formyltetrahydrofolate cyclo-ligase [Chlamydiae bacterium RIFCSPHIGHO2_12_FULL_27_8]|nr:MAG: 5-formyltetrahydrofolate cyclo-ligase [Chlamydiae bacterium RIFCSPHIGHO2_12_FULL_27_8]OGN65018.1 MAG: 5-formyltetrahydrofolate cyclo-ligase [Chlamydiae bacterium RIFCSPLOWO2_01_FULL_28_7]